MKLTRVGIFSGLFMAVVTLTAMLLFSTNESDMNPVSITELQTMWFNIENNDNINRAQKYDMQKTLNDDYNEKEIIFTGTVGKIKTVYKGYEVEIKKEIPGNIISTLIFHVTCRYDNDDKDIVYKFKHNQILTLIGDLSYIGGNGKFFIMENCRVVLG